MFFHPHPMHHLLLFTYFFTFTLAIIPVDYYRYVTSRSYFVSEQKRPTVSASSESKLATLRAHTQRSLYSSINTTNLTVLNLVPGISLLQTDQYNESYFVNTTIGQTEYPLIIDTGSPYLWVYGDDCDEDACKSKKLYTPTGSLSPTSTFVLNYVTGSAVGEVVEDNITVNRLATTQNFKFGMANTIPKFFDRYPVSGIFGLPSNDSSSIESIISALQESHTIDQRRFSISMGQLNPNDDNYPNDGIFAIGEPLKELYVGDIHYVSVVENPYSHWLIIIDKIFVGDSVINFSQDESINFTNSTIKRNAIVDSGTTVLALPKQDAFDVHSYFPKSVTDGTNFAIYCNSSLELGFQLNGLNFTLGPSDYLGTKYTADSGYDGYCVSNLQGINTESWILGSVFLKTVYADFDLDQQRVGFAGKNSDVILTSTITSLTSSFHTKLTATSSSSGQAETGSIANGNASLDKGVCFFSIITSLFILLLL